MQEVVRTFRYYYLPGWLRKGRVGSGQRGHGIFMISLWFRSTFVQIIQIKHIYYTLKVGILFRYK